METASVDSLMVLVRGGFTGQGRNQCDTVIAVTSATAPMLPVIHRIALADVSFMARSITRAGFSSWNFSARSRRGSSCRCGVPPRDSAWVTFRPTSPNPRIAPATFVRPSPPARIMRARRTNGSGTVMELATSCN